MIYDNEISLNPSTGIPEPEPSVEELELEIQHLQALLTVVEEEYEPTKETFDRLFLNNKVSFDSLWSIFPEGCEVSFPDADTGSPCAGKVFQDLYLSY